VSEETNSSTVEVSTELGEEIVRQEHGKRSTEGHSEHNRDTAQGNAEASKSTKTSDFDSDEAFHEAFRDAIADSKPLLTDKDRQAQEDREAARVEREQQANTEEEEQEEAEEEEAEENAGPDPLDAFPPDAVAKLAEQFGLTEDDLENPAVQRMLAARMSDQTEITNKVEPIQRAQMDEQRLTEHLQGLQKLSQDPSINDPQMVQAFENALAQCFDAQTPEALQSVKNMSSVLTQGGLNLMSTVVPQIMAHYLPQYIEQLLPGLADTHRSATAHNTWSEVRNSDPTFKSLPDVDSEDFNALREKVVAANPWLTEMVWKDANGNQLHPWHPQAVRLQAKLFARLASGERVSPDAIQKAVEQGRKEAQSHTRKVTASRSLRSGKSTGGSFGRPTSDTSFVDAIKAYNQSQRSSDLGDE